MKRSSLLQAWRRLGRSDTKKQNRPRRSSRQLLLEKLADRQLLTGLATHYLDDAAAVSVEWAAADIVEPQLAAPSPSGQAILGADGNFELASTPDQDSDLTLSFQINGGAALTRSRTVQLAITASSTNSQVTQMRFAINSQAEEKYSTWEPFATTKALTLPSWQGTNWVNVQVRDRAGNVRLAYRSIVLDTLAPTVSFSINGGAALTNSRTVNLALTATDATSGVAEMRFAINSQAEERYSAWEPFAATKTLTLPNWQGTNSINVQVRDRAGNVRLAYRSIVLDTLPPTVADPAVLRLTP